MSNLNQRNLQMGDVVYVLLMGLVRHYGIVVQAGSILQEPIIRTVLSANAAPINQSASVFSDGKEIYVIPYPSQLPRWQVAQNALGILSFNYHLLVNNCEHFFRRAHGLSDMSAQVLIGGLALAGCVVFSIVNKNPISIKV